MNWFNNKDDNSLVYEMPTYEIPNKELPDFFQLLGFINQYDLDSLIWKYGEEPSILTNFTLDNVNIDFIIYTTDVKTEFSLFQKLKINTKKWKKQIHKLQTPLDKKMFIGYIIIISH